MTPENMQAAVELHRPETSDRYAMPTTDPEKIVHRRCRQCGASVPEAGCKTWQVANR